MRRVAAYSDETSDDDREFDLGERHTIGIKLEQPTKST